MADLINRDAFIVGLKVRRAKAYLSELYDCDTEAEKQQIDDEMYYSTQSFIDVLMCEPAVDAVPVVHAHWICDDDDFNIWRCSSCGEKWTLNDGSPEENNMNFCFACGAKMDEDGEQK